MNLLNQRMLFTDMNEPVVENDGTITESVENVKDEMIVSSSDDTVANNVVDGKPSQLHDDKPNSVNNIDSSSLDEIENKMMVDDMFGFDTMAECINAINYDLESISLKLDDIVTRSHAAQYNLLTETTDTDQMNVLYESVISNLWKTLVDALTRLIEKCKELLNKLTFSVVANFDLYGKWASKYEEQLKNYQPNGDKKFIDTYEWNRSKIFQMSDFSRLHEYASTIIGNANTLDEMKRKLDEYYSRDFTGEQIYNYIMKKCCGVDIGDASSKSEVSDRIATAVKGKKVRKEITLHDVHTSLTDLKSVRSHVIKYANKSRFALMNPQFDIMLREAKRKMDQTTDAGDNLEYKYFRARYDVLSKAQQVAFDIYNIKIRLIKEYANSCKTICTTYMSTTIEESVDYMSMGGKVTAGAVVLD